MKEVEIQPLFSFDDANGDHGEVMSASAEEDGGAEVSNDLVGNDILSVSQFDHDKLDYIFTRALEMREMVERSGGAEILKGHGLACLFYEPSTRTSASASRLEMPPTSATATGPPARFSRWNATRSPLTIRPRGASPPWGASA